MLKLEHTIDVGAGAKTEDFPLAKKPISAIILSMDGLGSGAAGTIAHFKTQFGTNIYVKDGGHKVTPDWSLTEWYEYLKWFFGIIPPFQDGTAADNKLGHLSVIIPFGRPYAFKNSAFPSCLYDPHVGFVPENEPSLHLNLPADSDIDNRHIKVTVVYANKKPTYTKLWTEWEAQTLATTGHKGWTIGGKLKGQVPKWLEAFFFATSEYNATLTADSPTLKTFRVQRGSKDVWTDGEVPHVLGSLLDTDIMIDDQYFGLCHSYAPFDNFENCINLTETTKFLAFGGVADAFKAAFSILIRPTW